MGLLQKRGVAAGPTQVVEEVALQAGAGFAFFASGQSVRFEDRFQTLSTALVVLQPSCDVRRIRKAVDAAEFGSLIETSEGIYGMAFAARPLGSQPPSQRAGPCALQSSGIAPELFEDQGVPFALRLRSHLSRGASQHLPKQGFLEDIGDALRSRFGRQEFAHGSQHGQSIVALLVDRPLRKPLSEGLEFLGWRSPGGGQLENARIGALRVKHSFAVRCNMPRASSPRIPSAPARARVARMLTIGSEPAR